MRLKGINMKKWKMALPIALVVSLLLGCVSVNAQTSNEHNESDWHAQYKLDISKHQLNKTFSSNGVDKAEMNVVIRNNTTNKLVEAPFEVNVTIKSLNGSAEPYEVTIPKGEAMSEEISLTSEQVGFVTITAVAECFEAVNTSVEFAAPKPDPREILLEPYYEGKPILANESIWAGGDKKVTLRVKLLDKDDQPIYFFSSHTLIDISPSKSQIPIIIRKGNYYGEITYQEDVQGTVEITANSPDFTDLKPVTIKVKFATDPRILRLKALHRGLDVDRIAAGDDEHVTLRVSLCDEKGKTMKFSKDIEVGISTNRGENFPINIIEGEPYGEWENYALRKPGAIKFTAESEDFNVNSTKEVKFAVPSNIGLEAFYKDGLITSDNPVPVGGDKKVTLEVKLLDEDGAPILYNTPRCIHISTSKVENITTIHFPLGIKELPLPQDSEAVNITARSYEFKELEPATREVKFARPEEICLEPYSNGELIQPTDSILAHGFEKVTLKVSLLDENSNPINFTYEGTSILISEDEGDIVTIPIHKGNSHGVGELPRQKPGTVTITARSNEFSNVKHGTTELKFIYGVWMMICAALGGLVMYFLISLIGSQGDGAQRLIAGARSLTACVLCGLVAYLLFCLGARFETPIDISVLPVGSHLGAFLIGLIGGVPLIIAFSSVRHVISNNRTKGT